MIQIVLLAAVLGFRPAHAETKPSFDLIWKEATGGFVLRLGRKTFLMNRGGTAVGFNRFDEAGHLLETSAGQLDGELWKYQVIYQDPANAGAYVVRWRDGKLGDQPYREEIRRAGREKGTFEVVTRTWDPARKTYASSTRLVMSEPEGAHRIYERGCYNNLSHRQQVDLLVADLEKTGTLGTLTCSGGEAGSSPTFDKLPYGAIIGSKCSAGPGGAARRTRIERDFKEMLQRLTTCLTGLGEQGLGLAAQVAGIIQQGSDSPPVPAYQPRNSSGGRTVPRCADPNPFAIECMNEPCSEVVADAATGPQNGDWPRMRLNTPTIDKLIAESPQRIQSTLAHELMHNTGVAHGTHVDTCFAVQAACFPESNADPRELSVGRAHRGADAARRVLSGTYNRGADSHLDSDYLRDILHVAEAQGRDDYRVMLPLMTLSGIPRAERTGKAVSVIEAMLADQMEQGHYTFVYELASRHAELSHLPPAHLQRMREIAAAAAPRMGSENLSQLDRQNTAFMAEITIEFERGDFRAIARSIRRSGNGDRIRELNNAFNFERRENIRLRRSGLPIPPSYRETQVAYMYMLFASSAGEAIAATSGAKTTDSMYEDFDTLLGSAKGVINRPPDLDPACAASKTGGS